ncbi:AraC family transcriptional regulator [Paenibacillus sp. MBLB4367]|uniref:AraC family transcriptional regulator n=1 Tax=Paenibacillus sp. MBLB4367 TaxID=3384767 RepID=UPI003907F9C0
MSKSSYQDLQVHASLDDLWCKLRGIDRLRSMGKEQQLIESHVLFVAKGGEGRLTIDLQEYRLSQDTVHIALPGQTVGLTAGKGEKPDLYKITFDVKRDSESDFVFPYHGEIPVHADTRMLVLCDKVYDHFRSERPLERFGGQAAFQELLHWVIKQFRYEPESDSRTALDRTRAYIENHYSESLTIEQLARMAEISPKYYVNLFKKTYGISAIDYVTEIRVNAAKQLMVSSDVRLRDIAHQIGYGDEFYFSRMFKKSVGVSPTAYLKNRRRKIAAYMPHVLGHLLALKTIPYAAPLHPKWTAYYYRTYRADIPLHLSAYRFNEDWEANIRALDQDRPDLILSLDDMEADERERLERIAPVHYIPSGGTDWREQFRLTADVLGASQEAESWLRSYDRRADHVRERVNKELKEELVLPVSFHKQSFYVCPTRGMRDVLYRDLRMKPFPGFHADHYKQPISEEQLTAYDADRILLNVCQEPESLSRWQTLQASSMWKNLKAVRQNQVYLISSDPWREYSAYACERMIEDLLLQVCGDRP